MKKTVLRVIVPMMVIAAVALLYTNSYAGDYHTGTGLVCSDCHTMHNQADGTTYNAGVAQNNMLKDTSTNALCTSCHDGDTGTDAAPDVMDTAGADHATNRGAGAFRAAVGTASISAHNLGVAADGGSTVLGGTWTVPAGGLTCADCHSPHGNANYRNLQLRPGGFGSDINVTDVTQGVITPTATQYDVTNITYGADANNNPDMSNWCAGCHTDFAPTAANQALATFTNDANLGGKDDGDAAGAQPWHRHPVSHVTMTDGTTNSHTLSQAAYAALSSRVPLANGAEVPFCGTCHKAHGSDVDRTVSTGYPNNLIYDDSTSATIQDGTSMAQTCDGCHAKQ